MQINKRVALVAAASGACIAAALLAPTASGAASGYTVSKGGSIKIVNSGTLTFKDTTAKAHPTLTCSKLTGSGSAKKGSHKFVPATYKSVKGLDAAGTVSKHSLSGCQATGLGSATIDLGKNVWGLGFSSKSKTGGSGYLYNVASTISAAGGACIFKASGAVYGTYTNKTGVFAGSDKKSGLTVTYLSDPTICGAAGLKKGDKAYLSGTVKLTPKQTIK